MKVNFAGCAICGSTWGDVWETLDGEPRFFCCSLCGLQFRNLIERLHQETGWDRLDAVTIEGDRTGRTVVVERGADRRSFAFTFTTEGTILQFDGLGAVASSAPRAR